jgi:hypothetical protein
LRSAKIPDKMRLSDMVTSTERKNGFAAYQYGINESFYFPGASTKVLLRTAQAS